jgi:hypothetical protein
LKRRVQCAAATALTSSLAKFAISERKQIANGKRATILALWNSPRPECGRSEKVIVSKEVKNKILEIGINKCLRDSGFGRKNFIRKLVRGVPVKLDSYEEFVHWLQGYGLEVHPQTSGFRQK